MKHKPISKLTNRELARLLFRFLWRMHDSGGISMRRHIRNWFLDTYLNFTPVPQYRMTDRWGFHELMTLAKKRNERPVREKKIRALSSINELSDGELVLLSLCELRAWHEETDRLHPFDYFVEREVVDVATTLLGVPREYPKFDRAQVAQYGSWRWDDKITEEQTAPKSKKQIPKTQRPGA